MDSPLPPDQEKCYRSTWVREEGRGEGEKRETSKIKYNRRSVIGNVLDAREERRKASACVRVCEPFNVDVG